MTRPSRVLSAPTLGRALAEIAIIVAGVLIALGADAWWTERQDDERGRAYLARIAEDLRDDQAMFLRTAEEDAERMVAADAYLRWVEHDDDIPADSVRRMILLTQAGMLYPLRAATWKDLASSGGLPLIEDPEVRNLLLGYYESIVSPLVEAFRADYEGIFDDAGYGALRFHVDSRALFGPLADDPEVPLLRGSQAELRADRVARTFFSDQWIAAYDRAQVYRALAESIDCMLHRIAEAGISIGPGGDIAPDVCAEGVFWMAPPTDSAVAD